MQRLSGQGGDPVIGLQTAFGGGKTHTLLAVYHLARHLREGGDPADLPGLAPVMSGLGNVSWRKPELSAFVGSSKGTDVSLTLKDGPRLRTLWGYLAWRIAGEAGLELVAEAEAARTNPGSELMVEVFRLAGPSVILLDELVMFARQLDDARFEAFLSFIQSLTEAAKMVPGVLIIGSLPESDAEAGGARGREALLRLEKVFGRVQSPWLPASGNETYEIVRRRLFQALDAEGERARDETVKAFADLYRRNPAEFPPEAREPRYTELLRLSYPIHPELFDRLAKDWSSLEKFQRTRDVLRFMANVVGVLWQAQVRDPLILPARVPVAHERVRASVLYPLDPAFAAVVDREVDGDGSLPARMEANPTRRISQARAATRAARAVFLCSAPLVGQPNAGLTGQGLRLACAEPGDQLAIFGEALRELSERATFLYEEAGRYWFSTQQTLNRLAEDLAKALPAHEVDAAIVEVLREDGKAKGRFHRVFAVPDDPTAIDEAEALSLVILGPATPHVRQGRGQVRRDGGGHRYADALPQRAAAVPQYSVVRRGRRDTACDSPRGDAAGIGVGVDRRRPAPGEARRQAAARPNDPGAAGGRTRQIQEQPRGRGASGARSLEPRAASQSRAPSRVSPSISIISRSLPASAPACRRRFTKRPAPKATGSSRRHSAAKPWPRAYGVMASRPAAFTGGRNRRVVRDLRLSAETARQGRAGDRDPRRTCQPRSEIRLRREF